MVIAKPSISDTARSILGVILIVLGFGSLLLWRLPLPLTLVSVVIGAIAGALWLTNNKGLDLAGAIVLAFGVQYVTDKANVLGPAVMWWQPGLVLVAGCSLVFFLATRWLGSRRS